MAFILHQQYRNLHKLTLPIRVTDQWFNRGYYSIRLKEYASTPANAPVQIFNAGYDIRLKLDFVPPEFLANALRFCFYEIFYILKHNSYIRTGSQKVRVVLMAESLKSKSINLRDIELNRDGADMLLHEIDRTVQSNEHLFADKSLELFFCSIKTG